MEPSDPTIAVQFNTYRFADYKVKVIDLLKRLTTVSVGSRPPSRDGGGEGDEKAKR